MCDCYIHVIEGTINFMQWLHLCQKHCIIPMSAFGCSHFSSQLHILLSHPMTQIKARLQESTIFELCYLNWQACWAQLFHLFKNLKNVKHWKSRQLFRVLEVDTKGMYSSNKDAKAVDPCWYSRNTKNQGYSICGGSWTNVIHGETCIVSMLIKCSGCIA